MERKTIKKEIEEYVMQNKNIGMIPKYAICYDEGLSFIFYNENEQKYYLGHREFAVWDENIVFTKIPGEWEKLIRELDLYVPVESNANEFINDNFYNKYNYNEENGEITNLTYLEIDEGYLKNDDEYMQYTDVLSNNQNNQKREDIKREIIKFINENGKPDVGYFFDGGELVFEFIDEETQLGVLSDKRFDYWGEKEEINGEKIIKKDYETLFKELNLDIPIFCMTERDTDCGIDSIEDFLFEYCLGNKSLMDTLNKMSNTEKIAWYNEIMNEKEEI